MFLRFPLSLLIAGLICACSDTDPGTDTEPRTANPLVPAVGGESVLPPFAAFTPEHFDAALANTLAEHARRVESIAGNTEPPDFFNTVAALDQAGREVDRLLRLLYGLNATGATPAMLRRVERLPARLRTHFERIHRMPGLYARVARLAGDTDALSPAQRHLTMLTLHRLRRHGAGLDHDRSRQLAFLCERLDHLGDRFERNLAGRDSSARAQPADRTPATGRSQPPPAGRTALAQATDREQRAQAWQALRNGGNEAAANEPLIHRIVDLRARRARLLGYPTPGAYWFQDSAAGDAETVAGWLQTLAERLEPALADEVRQLEHRLLNDGQSLPARPWDWRYYRETADRGTMDGARAYFPLAGTREGAFLLADRLFGLSFRERSDLRAYHFDVRIYEVLETGGDRLGFMLMDDHARPGKREGAWTSQYTWRADTPVAAMVTGFPRPAGDDPALLTVDQVRTLFHEFGHALHLLMAHDRLPSRGAAALPDDGIEFPALLFERLALHPDLIADYARHHASGRAMPAGMRRSLIAPAPYAAMDLAETIQAAWVDLNWRLTSGDAIDDVDRHGEQMVERLALPDITRPAWRSRHLARVFVDDGRTGQYRYLLAEMLAADVHARFLEAGLSSRKTALKLEKHVFRVGNRRPLMRSVTAMMGRPVSPDALLAEHGLGE